MKSKNLDISIERNNKKEQGFFDGRFRERKIKDKKKEKNKYFSREKIDY